MDKTVDKTVDKTKVDERLQSPDNLVNRFSRIPNKVSAILPSEPLPLQKIEDNLTIVEKKVGRPTGEPLVPKFVRTIMAIEARTGSNQSSIAKEFGVSQPEVSYCKTGKVATNKTTVEAVVSQVRDAALEKLMRTLHLIDDDKLSGCGAKDLAIIGKNLSGVVNNMRGGSSEQTNNQQVNFVIQQTNPKSEAQYETVQV